TRTARAEGTSTTHRAAATARVMNRRNTNPPSARGSDLRRRGRSSDSGLPPPPPSRPSRPVASDGGATPLTAAGPSRIRTGFPYRVPLAATLSWPDVLLGALLPGCAG